MAKPQTLPFVPCAGGRHLPVLTTVPKLRTPNTQMEAKRPNVQVCCDLLQHAEVRERFQSHMRNIVLQEGMTLCSANMDQVLNQAWEQASKSETKSTRHGHQELYTIPGQTWWNLRHQLRRARITTQANIFRQWFIAIKLQKITRQVRKAHRQRKQNLVNQVLSSQSVFRASRRLAPKHLDDDFNFEIKMAGCRLMRESSHRS